MNFFSKSGVSRIVVYSSDLRAEDLPRTGAQFRSLQGQLESKVTVLLNDVEDLSLHSLALLLRLLKTLENGDHEITIRCNPRISENLHYLGLHALVRIEEA